jgi:alkylation response protein AidB-like acyl-CoA dehydrogenase
VPDLVFTPEQDDLRDAVRRFLADKSPSDTVRRYVEDDGGYDASLWQAMTQQLGLAGLALPEKYGGSGGGMVELGIVLEELGRALACTPYFATVGLAATVLSAYDDDAAKADLLPGIADGSTTATLALAEDDAGWQVARLRATATRTAEGYVLDGTKAYVVDGHTADVLLVVAAGAAGPGLYVVAAEAPGLTRTPVDALDLTRPLARVELAGTPARLVGDEDGGATLQAGLDRCAIALANEQAGAAARCLDMSVDYAKVRVQFGRPIGSFQAIKHKCADMLLEVESARSLAYWAAAVADDDEDRPLAAAMAQAYCSEACTHVAEENVQVHGGIGFTWEHDAHLFLRRAKSSELLFGDPGFHRERIAAILGV